MNEAPLAPPRRVRWIVAFAAALVFANVLGNELVYDSLFMVQGNATFREIAAQDGVAEKVAGLGRLFHEGFWDGVNRGLDPARQIAGQALYRPLMMVVLGASYLGFGPDPRPLFLIDLLWHVLASVLVVSLAWRLVKSSRVAAIAGLLFAVHPIHSEAVAYAVGLGETQATFFSLLALVLWWDATAGPVLRRGKLALSVVSFAVALFTKESAAAVLVLLVLLDVARGSSAPAWRTRLVGIALFGAVIAANLFVRHAVLGTLTPDPTTISRLDNPLIRADFATRLATGATLFARGVQLFVLPLGQSADYSFNHLPLAHGPLEPAALSALALLAAMTVAGFALLRRAPALGFGLLAYLFCFGPVSNIPVAHGTIFGERLLYLPSVGLCLAAGALIASFVGWLESRGDAIARAGRAALVALLVVLCVTAALRNRAYATSDALYKDMIETAPRSARARFLYAENERRRRAEKRGGDLARAIGDYIESIRIWPNFFVARLKLGVALEEQGETARALETLRELRNTLSPGAFRRQVEETIKEVERRNVPTDPAKAREYLDGIIGELEIAYRDQPDDVGLVVELTTLYMLRGRFAEADQAVRAALAAHPADDRLRSLQLELLTTPQVNDLKAARALSEQLLTSEAPDVNRLARLYQANFKILEGGEALARGDSAAGERSFDEALALLDKLCEEMQGQAAPFFYRAQILKHRRRFDEAMRDLLRAMQVQPAFTATYDELTTLLVGMGKSNEKAVEFFATIEREQPEMFAQNADFQYRFAIVLSRIGKHDEAAARVEKSIALGNDGPATFARLGAELILAGKPADALARLVDAEEKRSFRDPDLGEQIGVALFELDRFDEAAEQFKQAYERASERPDRQGLPAAHLAFQHGKALLRVPARAAEGRDMLVRIKDQLERAYGDVTDPLGRRAVQSERCYVLRQLAWAHRNVPALKDDAQAKTLLDQGIAIATEEDLPEVKADLEGDRDASK